MDIRKLTATTIMAGIAVTTPATAFAATLPAPGGNGTIVVAEEGKNTSKGDDNDGKGDDDPSMWEKVKSKFGRQKSVRDVAVETANGALHKAKVITSKATDDALDPGNISAADNSNKKSDAPAKEVSEPGEYTAKGVNGRTTVLANLEVPQVHHKAGTAPKTLLVPAIGNMVDSKDDKGVTVPQKVADKLGGNNIALMEIDREGRIIDTGDKIGLDLIRDWSTLSMTHIGIAEKKADGDSDFNYDAYKEALAQIKENIGKDNDKAKKAYVKAVSMAFPDDTVNMQKYPKVFVSVNSDEQKSEYDAKVVETLNDKIYDHDKPSSVYVTGKQKGSE